MWRHKMTRAPDLGRGSCQAVPQFGAKTAENPGIRGGTLLALVQNLGAPPDLVSATSEAMIDETRHAQIAFGLASRYGAKPIGPGKLSMDAALEELDIESILVNAVLEGCCGETAAAYEVALAAEGAADPELRET